MGGPNDARAMAILAIASSRLVHWPREARIAFRGAVFADPAPFLVDGRLDRGTVLTEAEVFLERWRSGLPWPPQPIEIPAAAYTRAAPEDIEELAEHASAIGIHLALAVSSLSEPAPSDAELLDASTLLQQHLVNGIEAAALALTRAAHGTVAAVLADGAAIVADDSDASSRLRVAALLGVALLARRGVQLPPPALRALGDDLLIDDVLATGASAALTGVVAAAADRLVDHERRYIAQRLAAAELTGEHVAALHVAVGDLTAAASAAAGGLTSVLRDHGPNSEASRVVVLLITRWTDELGARFSEPLTAQLSVDRLHR